MARSKRERRKSDMIIYSFGVDNNDPKYQELIEYLDSIDIGLRSHLIRQILNSYVKSQSSVQTVPLIPTFSQTPVAKQEEVKIEEKKEIQKPVIQEVENKEDTVSPVQVQEEKRIVQPVVPNEEDSKPNENELKGSLPKAIKKNPKLSGLAKTFN